MNRYEISLIVELVKMMGPRIKLLGSKIWEAIRNGELEFHLTDGKLLIKSRYFIKGTAEIDLSDLCTSATHKLHD